METTKSVTEIFDESPDTDSTEVFNRLWSNMGAVRDRIQARFELTEDPSVDELATFGGRTGPRGELHAWTGPEVDWCIHTWIGDPAAGFTNMHLTVLERARHDRAAPRHGLGHAPDVLVLHRLLPRVDLFVDLDYVDRYYEPTTTPTWRSERPRDLAVRQPDTFTRSRCLPPRCASWCRPTDRWIDQMAEMANLPAHQWLSYHDDATPTPADAAPRPGRT